MSNKRLLSLVDAFLANIPEGETDFISALQSCREDVVNMEIDTDKEMWDKVNSVISLYVDAEELKTLDHMTGWRKKVITDLNPRLDKKLKKPKKPKKKEDKKSKQKD